MFAITYKFTNSLIINILHYKFNNITSKIDSLYRLSCDIYLYLRNIKLLFTMYYNIVCRLVKKILKISQKKYLVVHTIICTFVPKLYNYESERSHIYRKSQELFRLFCRSVSSPYHLSALGGRPIRRRRRESHPIDEPQKPQDCTRRM